MIVSIFKFHPNNSPFLMKYMCVNSTYVYLNCFFFRRYDDPEYQDKLARVDSRTGQVTDQQVCIYSSFGNSF